jgi:hypothetical protein
MPKLISTFSNGHTDTYNGKRDVKAGWMITGPQGDFFTGHSQDRETARKTAEGKASYLKGAPCHCDRPGGRTSPAREAYFAKLSRSRGFPSWKAEYADYTIKIAAFRAQCRIEIVEL